jgi:DNA-binding IclR family transcriptional regulator
MWRGTSSDGFEMKDSASAPVVPLGEQEAGGLQGVGRALDILEYVADRSATATGLVQALGIKWATAHRTLRFLAERGYLERDKQTGVYSIGPRAYAVGGAYVANLALVHVGSAHLPPMVEESGATAQLVRRDGDRSLVLSVNQPAATPVAQTSVGYNWPLHCGSKGHVLLAWESAAFVERYLSQPLPALTPHTITDPEKLRARFALVRERGYAVTSRDTRLFSASVAAPIRAADGDVVASLTLIVPPTELQKRMTRLIEIVLRRAEAISLMLGWRPEGAAVPSRWA